MTSGSVDNVVLLDRREARLAFSLADTAAEAVAGTGPFREPVPIRALARLYTNSVHVIVPSSSPVDRVADLRDLRVSVGAPGSGTELNATRMLAVALGAPSAVQVARFGVRESAQALAAGRLDAFFWSGGLPTQGIASWSTGPRCGCCRPTTCSTGCGRRTGSTSSSTPSRAASTAPPGT
ncbi:MAG: TAXI family TRAP transporter solute-binding subunit [Actinomycetota bacterium]|nr:TAXI family TRAP transporter solute-binding subunit [Actinomycetota bacterium]